MKWRKKNLQLDSFVVEFDAVDKVKIVPWSPSSNADHI